MALIKGLFAGLTRGVTAMLMSLAGGLCSALCAWLLLRKESPFFGFCGVGVCCALCHNAAQLCVAAVLTSPAVAFYIPWLLLFGVLSGVLTGFCLRVLLPLLNAVPPPFSGRKP